MDSKKIGAFIAENRRKKNMTQEQLGSRLSVSNKTISRWENGNYMPDLSLLEPLSRELGISINELLAGEEIPKENSAEYMEKNIISTIDYTDKKIKDINNKITAFIFGIGVLICICAFIVFPSESSWGSIYSFAGLILITAGVFRMLKCTTAKKILISICLFAVISCTFVVSDYVMVNNFKQPPRYRLKTTTIFSESKIVEYENLFYNVYRINADTPNEYYLIDKKKQYDIYNVPVSPFNQDISSIEQLTKFRSRYVGDNSNTGNLINSLPLSEHGYVFEIDSENCGVTVDYHYTDWYDDETLYTRRALLYNSVSMFGLIKNLEYISYNFSGSSFCITRDAIEDNYPGYREIFEGSNIDIEKFHNYVDQKITDNNFVNDMMKLFETE